MVVFSKFDVPTQRKFFKYDDAVRHESVRLTTFADWDGKNTRIKEMASSGLIYFKGGDKAFCIFCHCIFQSLDEFTDPRVHHFMQKPVCTMINPSTVFNVPISLNLPENQRKLYAFLEEYAQFRWTETVPPKPYEPDLLARCGVPFGETLANYQTRLATFKAWPYGGGKSKEKMALAGFILVGLPDFVICFNCGGGLHTWIEEINPCEDHYKYYSHCAFIQNLMKGKTHGIPVMGPYPADRLSRSIVLTDDEAELLLHHPALQGSTINKNQEIILAALKSQIEKTGHLPKNFEDIIECIEFWERCWKIAGAVN